MALRLCPIRQIVIDEKSSTAAAAKRSLFSNILFTLQLVLVYLVLTVLSEDVVFS